MSIRVENGHAHADTSYKALTLKDYYQLLVNCLQVKLNGYKSLNVHLPFEIQHPLIYPNLENGIRFVKFGEILKKILRIRLFWENAPEEIYGKWSLKSGQTEWQFVPRNIDICLDIGHASLGFRNIAEAKKNIGSILKDRGGQIKHLHIHCNNLLSDEHIYDSRAVEVVYSKAWIKRLKENRSYIYEKGE